MDKQTSQQGRTTPEGKRNRSKLEQIKIFVSGEQLALRSCPKWKMAHLRSISSRCPSTVCIYFFRNIDMLHCPRSKRQHIVFILPVHSLAQNELSCPKSSQIKTINFCCKLAQCEDKFFSSTGMSLNFFLAKFGTSFD